MNENEEFPRTLGDKSYDHYNTISLKQHSRKELLKEYRRFRKEAKRRIKDLKKAGFGDSLVLKNKEYLQQNPSFLTKQQIVDYLSYTAAFVHSKLSTVSGQEHQRDATVEKLQDLGYKHITKKNIQDFGKFMDATRYMVKNKVIGSDELVRMFDIVQEKHISVANVVKNVNWYLDNIDEIEEAELNERRKRAYTKRELEKIFSK